MQDDHSARVTALEEGLQAAIDYLRRFPVVPVTAAKIRELERILIKKNAPEFESVSVGELVTPVGVPLLRAVVSQKTLTLASLAPPTFEFHLVRQLRGQGVQIKLDAPIAN